MSDSKKSVEEKGKRIFLYKRGSVLDSASIAALVQDGFIPIEVDDLDDVKVIQYGDQPIDGSHLMMAGIRAMAIGSTDGQHAMRKAFVEGLVSFLPKS